MSSYATIKGPHRALFISSSLPCGPFQKIANTRFFSTPNIKPYIMQYMYLTDFLRYAECLLSLHIILTFVYEIKLN